MNIPERPSAYASAPGWYWRIAIWCGGWRGEVHWWTALFLLGLALGLVVGFIGGVAL